MAQGLGLLIEPSAVQCALLIDDVRVDDRHASSARLVAYADGGRKGFFDARIEITCRLKVGLHEIYQQQRRVLSKSDTVFVDTSVVGFSVASHGPDLLEQSYPIAIAGRAVEPSPRP